MKQLFYAVVFLTFLASCGSGGNETTTETTPSGPKDFGMDLTQGQPQGLQIGQKSPGFGTRDIDGNSIDLYNITKSYKVVIVFYRGSWCPHCSQYMANLSDSVNQIVARGAKVIAITPENRDITRDYGSTLNTGISLISDNTGALMRAFDVRFNVNEEYQKQLAETKGFTLEERNRSENALLPVPATYIIDQSGSIVYRHFDYNYEKRPTVKEILKYL